MTLAIIGLGYVGLPLAVEFGKQRQVVGFDINAQRINPGDKVHRVASITKVTAGSTLEVAGATVPAVAHDEFRAAGRYRPNSSSSVSATRI